jgi:hypothetical protein
VWQALSMRWGAPIEELQTRLSFREFRYWVEVYKQRPFDDEHTLFLAQALLRADMRALAGTKNKKINIEDLIPYRPRDASNDLECKIDEVL